MNRYTQSGFGDSETWPPYYGHPNDPRDPDDGSQEHDEEQLEEFEGFAETWRKVILCQMKESNENPI